MFTGKKVTVDGLKAALTLSGQVGSFNAEFVVHVPLPSADNEQKDPITFKVAPDGEPVEVSFQWNADRWYVSVGGEVVGFLAAELQFDPAQPRGYNDEETRQKRAQQPQLALT